MYGEGGGNANGGSPGQFQPVNKLICRGIAPTNAARLSETITERGLTESLLEAGEEYDEVEGSLPVTIASEVADSIIAWQDVAPNAQIIVQRRKRVPARSADEAHTNRRNRTEEMNRYQKKTVESIFTTAAIWRLCVEPTTFRYIPNNGRYRVSKYEHKLDRDSKIARTIRSMEKLSPEQRHLQKEIQRELRQEFEIQQRLDRQAEQRQRMRAAEARRLESRGQRRGDYLPDEQSQYRVPMRKAGKDPLFHRRVKTPVELPPINVPLIGRAVNDNYIDSFNVRIHNLDEEMKRDQVVLRKKQQIEQSDEPLQASSTQLAVRARSEPVTNAVQIGPNSAKSSHYMDFSGLPLFTEPVTEDCLSVKPIASKSRQKYSNESLENVRGLSENNNNNEGLSSGRSTSIREDESMTKTVFIKYTTSKGDVVRIPKYSSTVPATSASAPPSTNADQSLVLRRSNGSVNGKASKAAKENGTREYYVSTNGSFKYTSRVGNSKKGPVNHGVFVQEEDPPVIIAEGLFSRTKEGVTSENIQVTVTKRQKDKALDSSLQKTLVPGVAGKNCEVSQRI